MSAYPSADDIRAALVVRVTEFCDRTGIQPRTLCLRAIADPNFFMKVKTGGNFTLKTYERVLRYLDDPLAAEQAQEVAARKVAKAAKGAKAKRKRGKRKAGRRNGGG